MNLLALESRLCPSTLIASSGSEVAGMTPFPGYHGEIEIAASGDLLVAAAQSAPHVKVFQGQPGFYREIASFYAYAPEFLGGVRVATDGESVATGTRSGSPHVREFTRHGEELRSFFQGDPSSTQGARVAYASPVREAESFSVREGARVQIYLDGASNAVAKKVGEAFAEFGFGATNQFPSQADPKRIATAIFGGERKGNEFGQAIVSGYAQQSEFVSMPARVYSDSLTEDQQARAAIHELGHLFGAPHSIDPRSVMFAGLVGGLEFDPLSRRIISRFA